MKHETGFELETAIERWRSGIAASGSLVEGDADELEDHLRSEISSLSAHGLSADEAFLIASRRLGNSSSVAREYYKVNGNRLWKQLDLSGLGPAPTAADRHEIVSVTVIALLASLASQVPYLFGRSLTGPYPALAARQLPFLLFPFLGAYIAWKRRLTLAYIVPALIALVAGAITLNLYPFRGDGDTIFLATTHSFLAYWAYFGLLYVGHHDAKSRPYLDFLRYSGELFIYTVLICLGGAVLLVIFAAIFTSIGLSPGDEVMSRLAIAGAFAAPVVGTWLVESKRSVSENIAPVLAKLFVPLFFVAMLAFIIAMVVTGESPFVAFGFPPLFGWA
jgi:hypothetical protein